MKLQKLINNFYETRKYGNLSADFLKVLENVAKSNILDYTLHARLVCRKRKWITRSAIVDVSKTDSILPKYKIVTDSIIASCFTAIKQKERKRRANGSTRYTHGTHKSDAIEAND